jgi:predicted nucleotidyltransferase
MDFDMLMEHLHERRDAIKALGNRFGARRMRVFGSVARGEERADSDVDILVEFDEGYDLFAQRLPLAQHLAELLGRSVDLVPEHELNPHLRAHILREAVAL